MDYAKGDMYFYTQRYAVPYEALPKRMRQDGVEALRVFQKSLLCGELPATSEEIYHAWEALEQPAAATLALRLDLDNACVYYAVALCNPGDVFSRKEGRSIAAFRLNSRETEAKSAIRLRQRVRLSKETAAEWRGLDDKAMRARLLELSRAILKGVEELKGCPPWFAQARAVSRKGRKVQAVKTPELEA